MPRCRCSRILPLERLQAQVDGIAACATLHIRSQIASMQALLGLLSEEATYNALDAKVNERLKLARGAEERLRQNQRPASGTWTGECRGEFEHWTPIILLEIVESGQSTAKRAHFECRHTAFDP